ncbi:MAG: phosphoribosylformylglycinamidine synthase subunit PurL [Candidatus Roseilinea sp.]|nr:MAG: phosphoribosylformylglycinamidine synthase subunit PurL [Candidatus Roseilinea sp.]
MVSKVIYRIEVHPRPTYRDARCVAIAADIQSLGIAVPVAVEIADLYFLSGALDEGDVARIAEQLLCDPVTQTYTRGASLQPAGAHAVEVALRPGVTDAVADELTRAARELGVSGIERAATGVRYVLHGALDAGQVARIARRLLANDVIQTFTIGAPIAPYLHYATAENPHIEIIPMRNADDEALMRLSRERRLALNLDEMRAIRNYFVEIGRDPTDAEIETLAQTWSEHCVHKTFKAMIEVEDSGRKTKDDPGSRVLRQVDSLLKTFIKRATDEIAAPWVKSAFVDNAGVIAFDEEFDLAFKAETHNHPSAIEPFGGANTGVGGVIRDIIAVSARPIANTDVLCFGPQDWPFDALPEGVLHPRRVRSGVIAGIEDYGNKMGIPTVSGAIVYDEGYIANPLVYCGCVGIAPANAHPRAPRVGDRIIVLGGRTGRDGLRGATFSSAALTHETGDVAGASVQIGNPIVEKNVLEVVMAARDAKLYHAITDCGAGGLSSAVGEMGSELGVRVQLERVPLKYAGLAPWEIWLSEAQERMVLAVPQHHLPALQAICNRFDCEMSDIGEFTGDGQLRVCYGDQTLCDLSMLFLHSGLPRRVMRAVVSGRGDKGTRRRADIGRGRRGERGARRALGWSPSQLVAKMLAHPNVASKEDVIRVYDHEVQGGTVIKPLVGMGNHGPSDAVVIKPQGTRGLRGFALACGINPNIGKHDAYAMAVSVVDEAVRNLVCVGADPSRIALLDNFCWGDPNDPVELGGLVEACRGCYDAALHYRAPFISGKDSLNNTYRDAQGNRISIPGTLLISAIGIVDDVTKCVTMDLKRAGSRVYLLGETKDELAGSLFEEILGVMNNDTAPEADTNDTTDTIPPFATTTPTLPEHAPALYTALHNAITRGLVRAAHDCSEGGLAVALAEMAQAGQLGIQLEQLGHPDLPVALFSESNGRIVVEVAPEHAPAFEAMLQGLPWAIIGVTTESPAVRLPDGTPLVEG